MTVNDRILLLLLGSIQEQAHTQTLKRLSESTTLRHQLAADVLYKLYLWLCFAYVVCELTHKKCVLG